MKLLPAKDFANTAKDEHGLLPGTEEYRWARKRRQNRESAARTRARKVTEFSRVESQLAVLKQRCHELSIENASLRSENEALRAQVLYFQSLLN